MGDPFFVPKMGFEPTRPFEQSILSAPRLPFRHFGSITCLVYYFQFKQNAPKVNHMLDSPINKRVVVVEDESIIRLDIVESLTDMGYEIVGQGADGLQAIELATNLKPDLIVMDVKMPNLDGLSATEKIAELKIPVVLLTAFSQRELIERATEAGAMAYLIKPFNPEQLHAAVEIAFSRHTQLRVLETEISDLNERFEARKTIDRAKGLLNQHAQMSEPDAFRWIQKQSMDKRVSMEEVASKVIEKFTSGE